MGNEQLCHVFEYELWKGRLRNVNYIYIMLGKCNRLKKSIMSESNLGKE